MITTTQVGEVLNASPEAISLHIADLRDTGQSVPVPSVESQFVELQDA